VADVRIYGDKALYGVGVRVADLRIHVDGGYPGERVDSECNWLTE